MLGTLERYDGVKAYGFIREDEDRKTFFAHKSEFEAAGIQPVDGLRVAFRIGADRHGRPRAVELRALPR